MSANVIMVHDSPRFVEEAVAALRLAGLDVVTFADPNEALTALENARFDILITRVRFAPGRPNGVSLAQMARLKRPGIKVLFTVAPENVEYTEGLGEFVSAPIDIPQLVAMVAKLASQTGTFGPAPDGDSDPRPA
jgi:DNA-binding NtrC family response regulator